MCIQHTLDNNFEQGIVIGCCCKVGLTDILDMYYEDVCTLRYKELSLGVVAKSFKSTEAFLCQRQISIVVASGVFLVAIRILGQRYLPHFPTKKHPVNSSDMISIQHQSMESCKKKAWKITYCVSIVRRINEFYCWPGDIWELPMFLKHAMDSKDSDLNSSSTPSEGTEDELKAAAQDIASYQVVLSWDGKIVEIQPTNRIAENQWEANPLVKELYGKKKICSWLDRTRSQDDNPPQ
ncbi:hypothetical protein P3L10_014359 [Capsicum annuum]